jgi:hypothetical protein
MTIGQIRMFLEETLKRGVHWKKIHLIGGEPTTHPQFDEILRMVLEYRDKYWTGTNVRVTSNGFGSRVNAVLARIPEGVDLCNTAKVSRHQEDFVPFNMAPCDAPEWANADFSNACCVTRDAGIGLGPYGYYPCVSSGAIDRIFGFDLGRKTLPENDDGMEQELRRFCSLCGFFRLNYTSDLGASAQRSAVWQKAYADWAAKKPALTRYPEW